MTHELDGRVLSFGGGVNSVALVILLANEGWKGPIVFAETSTEWPDTYCYMDMFEREWLRPRGLEITRLGAEWRRKQNQRSLFDHCEAGHVVPTIRFRWCTHEYKVAPLHKWMKAQGLTPESELLGIAADESWRMMSRPRPLVDRGIGRDGCKDIIRAAGFDAPHKSGCYICPFQSDAQWRELWARHPDLFAHAEALEASVTAAKPGRKAVICKDNVTTIATRRQRYELQMPLLDDDELMEYRPCLCSL
jgi:hypothetical protein